MPRYILKITDKDTPYYMEWSTIVDAPVTYGMSLEEFKEYYKDEYGRRAMQFEFEDRMKRVEEKGISSRLHDNVEEILRTWSEAGEDQEASSILETIVERFCRNRPAEEVSS